MRCVEPEYARLGLQFAGDLSLTLHVDKWPSDVTTVSKPDAFPSTLRHKRNEIQTILAGDVETWAKTAKVCPSCNNPEMLFKDIQLRGADEGTTIFYRCPNCQER